MGASSLLPSSTGRILCLALALAALSGCSGLRSSLGLDRNPPDEFRVVSRAPLEVPGSFTLPPPSPGTPRPQEPTMTGQAASVVFGSGLPAGGAAAPAGSGGGSGEAQLLARAGADAAQPDIRSTVNREALAQIEENESWIDTLIFWRDPLPPGTVVNPGAEAQRLRENEALGRPVTEGETPSIIRKRRAPLEGIF
jgi:hypothetical protein